MKGGFTNYVRNWRRDANYPLYQINEHGFHVLPALPPGEMIDDPSFRYVSVDMRPMLILREAHKAGSESEDESGGSEKAFLTPYAMRDIGDEVQSYVDKLNEALTKSGQKSLVFVYRDDGSGPAFSHLSTTLDPVSNLCAAVCLSSSVDDSISRTI